MIRHIQTRLAVVLLLVMLLSICSFPGLSLVIAEKSEVLTEVKSEGGTVDPAEVPTGTIGGTVTDAETGADI